MDQLLLINTQVGLPAQNAIRVLRPGERMTLSEANLVASFVSLKTNYAAQTWSSSDTSVAMVNSSTGTVTALSDGQSTMTVKVFFYGTSYTKTYTIVVIPLPDGTYFIKNREFDRYLQINDNDAPNYNTSGEIMEQWPMMEKRSKSGG